MFKLALPVSIGQLGHIVTALADNAMVGHIESDIPGLATFSLAAGSLANSLFAIFMVFGLGLSFAITPLVAGFHSRNETFSIKKIFIHSNILFLIISSLTTLLLVLFSEKMRILDQPKEVVELAIPYFVSICISFIPLIIFSNLKQFSEGLSFTKEPMLISVIGNLLNIFFNYLFIFGKGGFPEMGLLGAGIATLISRIIMAIFLFILIIKNEKFKPYVEDSFQSVKLEIGEFFEILKLGFPIGLQFLFEVLTFAIASIYMGWIGATAQAAHQVVLGLASVTYMIASGISAAATIKSGNYYGISNTEELRKSSISAIHLITLFMAITAILFVLTCHLLPGLFTNDPEVLKTAAQLMIIAALFQLSDGWQVTLQGVLRGMQDVNIPTMIAFAAYMFVGLPGAWFFGIHLNFGANGVWYFLFIALTLAAGANFLRLRFRLRKLAK
jgi:MATE family multidrug resistance protein